MLAHSPRPSAIRPIPLRPMYGLEAAQESNRGWLTHCRISVVIPAMNEAKNLPHVLPRIPEWVDEVLLVDGDSTDGTVEVARKLWPDIHVVAQVGRGKGAALRSGFAAATGDIVVMLDADGSMDPGEIPAYVGQLLAGADFVKGSRFAQGGGTADMTALRRAGNWALTQVVRSLFGGRFSDLCYGYAAFWRRVLPELALTSDGFEIETEMNVRALEIGLRVAEVPSFEAERIHGESNLRTFPDGWRVLKALSREAWREARREWAAVLGFGTDGRRALQVGYGGAYSPLPAAIDQTVGD